VGFLPRWRHAAAVIGFIRVGLSPGWKAAQNGAQAARLRARKSPRGAGWCFLVLAFLFVQFLHGYALKR